jgi:hypothetical protein
VTRFFVPPFKRQHAERAYQELREQAEECTGISSRKRRIESIECRHLGIDCRVSVGEPDGSGMTVDAIFQLGRDVYTVHHVPSDEGPDTPTVLSRTSVYSVVDFD